MLDFSRSRKLFIMVQRLRGLKTSLFSFLFRVPTSILALLLLVLLAYNALSIFYVHVPHDLSGFSLEDHGYISSFSSPCPVSSASSKKSLGSSDSSSSSSSSVMYVVREENSHQFVKPHFASALHRNNQLSFKPFTVDRSSVQRPSQVKKRQKLNKFLRSLSSENNDIESRLFASRVKEFFGSNCTKPRFFMTWISSLDSFGERELFAVESLFKTHPSSCLVIISKTMDSARGSDILRPFREAGFKVAGVSPDYDYVFRKTPAESWFDRLRRGNVKPGEISLGQNLSNLLRLCLLYKYGGVYTDTDIIFIKSFLTLRNAIGAQTIDVKTGNWSRLNNAVLVFDKNHPLLLQFIEEFALTFDGNKWGHNGPYLVSRVVSRFSQKPGFEFSILPPSAFYPVVWRGIWGLFRGSENGLEKKWRSQKLRHILANSYAVHLWNRQSKKFKVENGSVIDYIKRDFCVFCNHNVSSNNSSLLAI